MVKERHDSYQACQLSRSPSQGERGLEQTYATYVSTNRPTIRQNQRDRAWVQFICMAAWERLSDRASERMGASAFSNNSVRLKLPLPFQSVCTSVIEWIIKRFPLEILESSWFSKKKKIYYRKQRQRAIWLSLSEFSWYLAIVKIIKIRHSKGHISQKKSWFESHF